jgi:hypothetical protein
MFQGWRSQDTGPECEDLQGYPIHWGVWAYTRVSYSLRSVSICKGILFTEECEHTQGYPIHWGVWASTRVSYSLRSLSICKGIPFTEECEHPQGYPIHWWVWASARVSHSLMSVSICKGIPFTDEREHPQGYPIHWWVWASARVSHSLMSVSIHKGIPFTGKCEHLQGCFTHRVVPNQVLGVSLFWLNIMWNVLSHPSIYNWWTTCRKIKKAEENHELESRFSFFPLLEENQDSLVMYSDGQKPLGAEWHFHLLEQRLSRVHVSHHPKHPVCASIDEGLYVQQTCLASNLSYLPGCIRRMSLESFAFCGISGISLKCLWDCYEDLLQYK